MRACATPAADGLVWAAAEAEQGLPPEELAARGSRPSREQRTTALELNWRRLPEPASDIEHWDVVDGFSLAPRTESVKRTECRGSARTVRLRCSLRCYFLQVTRAAQRACSIPYDTTLSTTHTRTHPQANPRAQTGLGPPFTRPAFAPTQASAHLTPCRRPGSASRPPGRPGPRPSRPARRPAQGRSPGRPT